MIIAAAVLTIGALLIIAAAHRSALRCGAYAVVHGLHAPQTRREGWNSILLLITGIVLIGLAGFGLGVS